MVKRDCFGFDARCGARKTDRCTALTKLYCATEECKFYKTKEEYERQERRRKDGCYEYGRICRSTSCRGEERMCESCLF